MARLNLAAQKGMIKKGMMSKKELVLVASRAIALYFVAWALSDITYLPEHLLALSHYRSLRSVLASSDYSANYYLLVTVFGMLRMFALFLAATFFWRCGPRVEGLFSRAQGDQATSG
jgi:hypothetical protein